MSGAGIPSSVGARKQALEAERGHLLAEQARLFAELPRMEPAIAGRAAEVLADRFAALAAEYEALLEVENHGKHG